MSILVKGFILNKTITQLDLSHNVLGDDGTRKLVQFLLKTQILTHLNLSDNQVFLTINYSKIDPSCGKSIN